MMRGLVHGLLTAIVVSLALAGAAGAGDFHIGINIGVPLPPPVVVAPTPLPPPVFVEAPPRIVVVPGTPVYYAPGAEFNLFVYGGRYYSFHNGAWFTSTTHGGPWVVLERERVPRPVLAVPTTYYRMPPGQARKMGREEPEGHGRGARGRNWKDRDER
jgi:hypothetical protein